MSTTKRMSDISATEQITLLGTSYAYVSRYPTLDVIPNDYQPTRLASSTTACLALTLKDHKYSMYFFKRHKILHKT